MHRVNFGHVEVIEDDSNHVPKQRTTQEAEHVEDDLLLFLTHNSKVRTGQDSNSSFHLGDSFSSIASTESSHTTSSSGRRVYNVDFYEAYRDLQSIHRLHNNNRLSLANLDDLTDPLSQLAESLALDAGVEQDSQMIQRRTENLKRAMESPLFFGLVEEETGCSDEQGETSNKRPQQQQSKPTKAFMKPDATASKQQSSRPTTTSHQLESILRRGAGPGRGRRRQRRDASMAKKRFEGGRDASSSTQSLSPPRRKASIGDAQLHDEADAAPSLPLRSWSLDDIESEEEQEL